MSKINLPLDGYLNVPFQTLLDDPLLLLKKFPMVDVMEPLGPLSYVVQTVPFAIGNSFKAPRRWHINMAVQEDSILWLATDPEQHIDNCDGWIEGEIVAAPNDRSQVVLQAKMEQRFLNVTNTLLYKTAIKQAGSSFMVGLEANFNNPTFENVVPLWTDK